MSSSGISARVRKPKVRKEREPSGRMAVFLCRCGGSVDMRLDIESVEQDISQLEYVDECQILDLSCSKQGGEAIQRTVRELDLDRFVVAGCSPKVIEERLRSIAIEVGVNPYMIEIANIREQCSLVHAPEMATVKATMLVEAAAAKCRLHIPAPYAVGPPTSDDVLVYGNGMSLVIAVDELISEGARVKLVIPFPLERLTFNYHDGIDPDLLVDMRDRILESDMVNVYTQASIEHFEGQPGNFRAMLRLQGGHEELNFGAAIIAWEANEVPTSIVNGGSVITQGGLEAMIDRGRSPSRTIMVTLDDDDLPSSGRMTHVEAIRNALRIKENDPDAEVTIIARDVLAFGLCELEYRDAQAIGVRFIRTEGEPEIEPGAPVKVTVEDVNLGEEISLEADVVAVATGTQPMETDRIAQVFGTPVDQEGFFIPTQVKLKPNASIREGVFLCGTGVASKMPSEAILEARSASSRAIAMLSSGIEEGGVVADIDPEKCSACLNCVRSCPYTAPFIGDTGKADVDTARCQGCGICVGICPSKAIQLFCFTDEQISIQTEVLSREVAK